MSEQSTEQSSERETSNGRRQVKRALVSVYDKAGLEDLARGLHEAGVAIVSTGSTAAHIAGAGVPVTPVEQVTGFPEGFGGRVKTLHPHVHAGLLADRTDRIHAQAARAQHGWRVRPPDGEKLLHLAKGAESGIGRGAVDEVDAALDGGEVRRVDGESTHRTVAAQCEPDLAG